MPEAEGQWKDGVFRLTRTYDYKNPDDMAEFEKFMYAREESVESVIAETYHDTHVEVVIEPGW